MLRSYSKCVRFTPGLSRCLLFLKTTICYTRKNKRHHRGLISLLFSTREFSRVAVVAAVGSDVFLLISVFAVYCLATHFVGKMIFLFVVIFSCVTGGKTEK
jgi:hypothetical protein